MSQYWETLADKTESQNTVEDFESAAYRLIVEQVLYYADKHSRVAYWLVEQYENEFKKALAPLGVVLTVNRQLRYACAVPLHPKVGTASVTQTLLALVLRGIYDEVVRLGQMNEEGEAMCDLVGLGEKYLLVTKRDLPSRGDLSAALRVLKRWGIVRTSSDEVSEDKLEGQRYVIFIRPAIADILGEVALQRLTQWSKSTEEVLSEPAGDGNGLVSEEIGVTQ